MKNNIISEDVLREIHCTSFDKCVFIVPYDWMCAYDNRQVNADFFFKLYTMNNDTREILWHINHQLN